MAVGVCAVMLAGCGNVLPEMSDSEMDAISEYAAITMLKYDANSKSRLVDWNNLPEPKEEKPVILEPEVPVQESTEEPQASQGQDGATSQEAEGAAEASSIEEFLELPAGVGVSYVGYDVMQSYQQEDDLYFALEASAGKKLLVLSFDLQNLSGEDQNIRMIDKDNNYRITVNDSYTRTALTTMLDNDLSTFMGNVAVGESRRVVLLMEIDMDQVPQVDQILLKLKNDQTSFTWKLL